MDKMYIFKFQAINGTSEMSKTKKILITVFDQKIIFWKNSLYISVKITL